jgi:hypothetical protein
MRKTDTDVADGTVPNERDTVGGFEHGTTE